MPVELAFLPSDYLVSMWVSYSFTLNLTFGHKLSHQASPSRSAEEIAKFPVRRTQICHFRLCLTPDPLGQDGNTYRAV
jgi:hypothetical protein